MMVPPFAEYLNMFKFNVGSEDGHVKLFLEHVQIITETMIGAQLAKRGATERCRLGG